MKKVLSLVLAMITAASVMAGCTTLEKDETGNYDKGAIIDMYLTTEVYDFDPQRSITDDAMLKIYSLIYEGLTTINENGKWEKALMKNYKVEKDADGEFSILITLNNTRWSDGRTVQAADLVYSWKRLLDPDATSEAASLLYDIKNARDVKTGDATVDDLGIAAVDTYVLQVEFEQKVDLDLFFENCSSIALVPLREDVITRYKDANDAEIWAQKSTSIVTNGPFCPKEIIYGNTLRLERSSYYYLDAEKEEPLDKFVIPYRLLTTYSTGNADAQLAALTSGGIFYNGEIPMSARAQYAGDATITDMMGTHTYVFNTNNDLFAKPEVRKALSMAIDRNQIVSIVTYAKPATGYVPYKVFDTKSGTSFREVGGNILSSTADAAGAKSLLSSAGVNGGSFTLTVRNNEVDLAIAEYVAGVWGDLGFNVTVEAVKSTANSTDSTIYVDNFQALYDSGEFDVIGIDMMMLSTDAFSALSQFAVSFSGNGVDMDSENYDLYGHISGYASEDYNALIESAYAEKDRAARATILHQAEAKLLEDMPVIPVIFLQDAYLYLGELSGIGTTYYGTRDFNDTQLKDYMTYKARTASVSEENAAGGQG
ncbi:MAG: peptide ABC transporter substrate-binding protein [Clostridia bacterium]|nr:peptide ABC transporter substrate-binding protein [Clostridia bacterium]